MIACEGQQEALWYIYEARSCTFDVLVGCLSDGILMAYWEDVVMCCVECYWWKDEAGTRLAIWSRGFSWQRRSRSIMSWCSFIARVWNWCFVDLRLYDVWSADVVAIHDSWKQFLCVVSVVKSCCCCSFSWQLFSTNWMIGLNKLMLLTILYQKKICST